MKSNTEIHTKQGKKKQIDRRAPTTDFPVQVADVYGLQSATTSYHSYPHTPITYSTTHPTLSLDPLQQLLYVQ